jgi:hypothetical protein
MAMPGARLATLARGSLLLLLLATATPGAAAPPAAHRVYLARESADGVPAPQPADVFSCDSTVYAVAELEQLPRGQHELLAVWSDPQGKARERTPLPFQARLPKERVWVWLRLSRPAGAAAISFFDPAAGMGEFVGQWTVTLSLDGARLDTLRFRIQC